MKIAFFEVKPEEKVFFSEALKEHELSFFETTINDALTQTQEYEIVSVFVHSHINDAILHMLPKMNYLQTRSTGYDHIKCEELYTRELTLSNVAGYAGPAVGEFAFSLLLNATRKTYTSLLRSKDNNFNYEDLQGVELYGKTIGILGLGTIGERLAHIASGFGMNIMAYSRTRKPVVDELNINFAPLDELLTQSDIIMIALPLNPSTKNIINTDNASLIQSNAILINIARAEIIDESLYSVLPNIIATDFGLEAHVNEKSNILCTPHMAYYTKEALLRIMEISLENIQAFVQGDTLPNCLKSACHQNYSLR